MTKLDEQGPPWWAGPLLVLLTAFAAKAGECLAEYLARKTEKSDPEPKVRPATRWESP